MTDTSGPTLVELQTLDLIRGPRELPELDAAAETLRSARTAAREEDVLLGAWQGGEDVRLHEDCRFAPTPWGRWRLRLQTLANDRLRRRLLLSEWDGRAPERELARLDREHGGHHVFDPDDPRFHQVSDGRWVLADLPLTPADVPGEAPTGGGWAELLTLEAAAGRLGGGDAVEPIGWVALRRPVPAGAFVARVVGRSMEPGIPHGSYALFRPAEADQGVVLAVHAELADDDLVSCTVKRVARDARGQRVLVADNPEFRTRPILPDAASWDEVRCVAVLEAVLTPSDFLGLVGVRAPRVERERLTEADLERRLVGLRDRAVRLATPHMESDRRRGAPLSGGPEEWQPPELAIAADGMSLRWAFQGWDLPRELGQVSVAGRRTPAANLRRAGSLAVPPRSEPYRVEAVRAEPALLSRLVSLEVPGLAADRATLFRAPAGGAGSRLEGTELLAGRTYRLLLPPVLGEASKRLVELPGVEVLGAIEGWPVVELEAPAEEDDAWREALGGLGLTLGAAGLSVDLVGVLPSRLDRTPSGAVVPVFDADRPPIVRVSAGEPCAAGEVHLLVGGATAQARLTLDAGSEWLVRLDGLEPGIVVVEVRACDRDLAHDQRVLVVERPAVPLPPMSSRVAVRIGASAWTLGGPCPAIQDLRSAVGADGPGVVVEGPPCWPVRFAWGLTEPTGELRLRIGEEAQLRFPVAEVDRFMAEHVHAWVEVDAGELGTLRLLHQTPADLDGLARAIRDAEAGRGVGLGQLLGAHELLDRWVRPVLQALGYQVRAPECVERDLFVQLDRTALVKGAIDIEALGLLWVVRDDDDALSGDAVGRVERLIEEVRDRGLDVGILTNGSLWLRVEPRRRVLVRPRWADLAAALAAASDARLTDFAAEFMA